MTPTPSTLEMLLLYLKSIPEVVAVAPGGIFVGGATYEAEKQGAISIFSGGINTVERHVPMLRSRLRIACVHPTLTQAELIQRTVQAAIHGAVNVLTPLLSDGHYYRISSMFVAGGPTLRQTEELWETDLFAELYVSAIAVA
jgi:hypothetical protein